MTTPVGTASARRAALNRRARLLAWATIGYNTAEGVIAVLAGLAAGSVALVSFGLDSAVEVLSALAVSWQFSGRGVPEERERRTLRFIAVSFFVLAAYVAVDALRSLLGGADPDPSPVGIALALSSLVVMPCLVWAKRRVGRQLGSATVTADAAQTMLCTYLSAVLLIGLVLTATLGWGWADPIAALVIAAVAAREGRQAWRGDACCAPAAADEVRTPMAGERPGDCNDGCCAPPGRHMVPGSTP